MNTSTEASRDQYDAMLEDPEIRTQVKDGLRQLVQNGGIQPRQPAQQAPDPVQELDAKIKENDEWIDSFFEKPNDQRDYGEYERRRIAIERAERQKRELKERQRSTQQAVQSSGQVIDRWIEAQKAANPKIAKYADLIRQEARQLRPDVLADHGTLTNALGAMIEPRAYKQWREAEERKNSAAQTQRDVPPGNAYADEDEEMDEQKQDRFADASPEEREFLRGVGVIKKDRKDEKSGLIPTKDGDGFIIPIGRGRRNEPR